VTWSVPTVLFSVTTVVLLTERTVALVLTTDLKSNRISHATLLGHLLLILILVLDLYSGPGSSVGIATDSGLDGPGIEYRGGGGDIFRTRPDQP
jgi:hypothetical protein